MTKDEAKGLANFAFNTAASAHDPDILIYFLATIEAFKQETLDELGKMSSRMRKECDLKMAIITEEIRKEYKEVNK